MKQYSRGHWGVDVVLKTSKTDTITYPFIIDTGAQGAIFPTKLVTALGGDLNTLPEMVVQGAVGEKRLKQFSVDAMTIGEQTVENIEGVVLDLPFRASDYDMPGVLPYTFLNQFTPKFDLATKRFTLLPKTTKGDLSDFNTESFATIPFELKLGSFISVALHINQQKIAATLDSGAGNRIDMNWQAAIAMGINRNDPKLSQGDPIQGAGGKKLETLSYPSASVAINQVPLATRNVNIADVPILKMFHGDHPAANFGLGIFGKRQVIIDYQNQLLLLSKETNS